MTIHDKPERGYRPVIIKDCEVETIMPCAACGGYIFQNGDEVHVTGCPNSPTWRKYREEPKC